MPAVFTPGKLSNAPAVGYTPVSDTDPYVCVVIGTHPYMTNVAITGGRRGSLVPRGGTYKASETLLNAAPVIGDPIYVAADGSVMKTDPVTDDVAGTYHHFGRVCPGMAIVDNGSDNYSFEVEHDPNGTSITVSA